ncbi:hypothetical protein [Streptobacillus moniliformis]|uniref:hypothetical protein n=1 Tax=Streptobacillus moniliformis TaxID=34105 RepID=UPI0007E495A5|nr:hypothetical protein [Streptobacillus moniliformis]
MKLYEIKIKSELLKKITDLLKTQKITTPYCSDIIKGNRKAPKVRKKILEILKMDIEKGE